jgi:hypothetical protein
VNMNGRGNGRGSGYVRQQRWASLVSERIQNERGDDHCDLNEMCGTATRRLQRTRYERRENKTRTGNGKDEGAEFDP